MRRTFASRAATRRLSVPLTLDSCEEMGSLTERGTDASAPLMEDVVDAVAGVLHSLDILQIHLLKRDGVTDVGEVLQVAGGEVVDAANLVSLIDESMGQG